MRRHHAFHLGILPAALLLLTLVSSPAISQPPRAATANNPRLEVYAYTLRHQPVHEALALIRNLLSEDGTAEVQPGGNTLVLRDYRSSIARVVPVLESFDRQPQNLRFDIRIVRARPKRTTLPPAEKDRADRDKKAESGLSEKLEARLRSYLRYEEYQVLARAAMTLREREEVTYELGKTYSVSFRPGAVMEAGTGERLKLEGFRIHKQLDHPTNKGRRLEPEELFHANLNLWVERPFSIVLTQDEERQEALLIAISCWRESDTADDER